MNGQPRFTRYLKKSRNIKGRNKQTTTKKKAEEEETVWREKEKT